MKGAKATGWRGVMNRRPGPSDFGLSPLADNVDALTQRQRVKISRIRHGIGGGMRLSDETELAMATPSRFSGEWMGRRISLTGGRVVLGIYGAFLVSALLLIHIHLRFEVHDMKMQENSLQLVHRQLERELSVLDRGIARHANDLAHLKDYAVVNLAMVENSQGTELEVKPNMLAKYSPSASISNDDFPDHNIELARENSGNPFSRFASLAFAFSTNSSR